MRKPVDDIHISHLYFTNRDKDMHNEIVFEKMPGQTFILEAKDYKHSTCSKKIQLPKIAKDTAGLRKIIKLKRSMLIEICSGSLNILDGLVNGAEATFMDVTNVKGEKIMWVQFANNKIG